MSTRIGFKRLLSVTAALLALAFVVDLRRAPADQVSAQVAIAGIHVYQGTLSPLYVRAGLKCRFTPSCSHYGEEVVRRFGVIRGGWMATKRVLRCGPWTPMGTTDSPPQSL